ncbi:hypothetical protein [Crassaminicella indica]|uniref:Histidine kinase n=1 Tax=Crassaminicella indica TaxID=2855394 RepID=A0ABX8RBY9_9CLOT|nr:hypothetical protein [Crassaminicella indica]QXM06563.1 hypothetical protein KVH43_02095 [Crassaminicella indica]
MNEKLIAYQEESEEIYSLINNLDQFVDAILEIEIRENNNEFEFYIKDINTAYSKHLQRSADEIIGKNIFELYDEKIARVYKEKGAYLYKNKTKSSVSFYIKKEKGQYSVISEKEILVKEDTVFWEITLYHLIKENELNRMCIVIKNITKLLDNINKIKTKDALKTYNDKIMNISDIISNLSHMWRQPLNSLNFCIINLIDEIKSEYEDKIDLEDYYQEIWEIIKNLSKKIEKFQVFFEQEYKSEFFEVKKSIELTLEIMEEKIKKDHIKINIDTNKNIKMHGFLNEFAQLIYYILYEIIEYCKKAFDIYNRALHIRIDEYDERINVIILLQYNQEKYKTIDFHLNNLLMIKNITEQKIKGNIKLINNDGEKGIALSFPMGI